MADLPKSAVLTVEMAWKHLHDAMVYTQPQRIRQAQLGQRQLHQLMRGK
jgi:hypothetical protein